MVTMHTILSKFSSDQDSDNNQFKQKKKKKKFIYNKR